jgi:hypothetical protein
MGCDAPLYWDHPQIQATYSIWQKTDSALSFAGDWLKWCMEPAALCDERVHPDIIDFDDFVDHRHDQSVLTNLALKRGIVCFGKPHVPLAGSKDISNLIDQMQGKQLTIVMRNIASFGARQFRQRIMGK